MDEAGIQYLDDMIRRVDTEYVKVLLEDRSFEDLDVPIMLKKVTCPTLLLYGELEAANRAACASFGVDRGIHGETLEAHSSAARCQVYVGRLQRPTPQ